MNHPQMDQSYISRSVYGRTPAQAPPATPSCTTEAEREQGFLLIDKIFLNYGGPRQFVTRSALKTAIECVGPIGAEYEIRRIASERKLDLKDARARRSSRGRMPAQATEDQKQTYERWAVGASGLKTVSKVIKGMGVSVVAMTSLAGPEGFAEGMKAKGYIDQFAGAFDVLGSGAEMVATSYAVNLFTGHYDSDAIRQKMSAAKTRDEKIQVAVDELKTKAASYVEFDKLQAVDKPRALERAVANAMRFTADISMDLSKQGVEVTQLAGDLKSLSESQGRLRTAFKKQTAELDRGLGQLSGSLAQTRADQKEQFRFLLDINETRMTAGQKIVAIERFDYGSLGPEQKERRLNQLRFQAKVEVYQSTIQTGLEDIAGVRTILDKLGIKSPFLNDVVNTGQKVLAGVNAVAAAASGNYIGAAMQVAGMFGGGSEDAAAQQNAQVMEALGQIMALQKKTIELQIKTMEMIDQLAKSIDAKLNQLDYRIGQVLQLESFAWINVYLDRLVVPIVHCRDLKRSWRESMIVNQMNAMERRNSGLDDHVSEKPPETMLDHLVNQEGPFPVLPMSEWRRFPVAQVDFQQCYDDLDNIKARLLEPFGVQPNHLNGGNLPIPEEFTIMGSYVAGGGPDLVRQSFDQKQVSLAPLVDFLRALLKENPDLYDQTMMLALAPSPEAIGLVSKLGYLDSTDPAQLAADLKDFRDEQGTGIATFHALAERGMSFFLNPHSVSTFLRYWQDMDNLKGLMTNGQFLQEPNLNEAKKSSVTDKWFQDRALRVVNLVIVEQALLSGDALLAALDRYWKIPTKVYANSPMEAAQGAAGALPIDQLAYRVLRNNPLIRHNYIRYKLAQVFKDRPYVSYVLQHQILMDKNTPFLMQLRIAERELALERVKADDGTEEWTIRVQPGKVRGTATDEEHGKLLEAEFNLLREPLPSVEEFSEDQLILPSVIQELRSVQAGLMGEIFHHQHLVKGREGEQMILQEMLREVRHAAL